MDVVWRVVVKEVAGNLSSVLVSEGAFQPGPKVTDICVL